MANITRIKAKDEKSTPKEVAKSSDKPPVKDKKLSKVDKKHVKADKKSAKKTNKKPMPKFLAIITAPFRAIGRYIKASWAEIRQVRWPDRKLTWKMTLSVIIYVIVFATVIMLLDAFFTFVFNKLLGV